MYISLCCVIVYIFMCYICMCLKENRVVMNVNVMALLTRGLPFNLALSQPMIGFVYPRDICYLIFSLNAVVLLYPDINYCNGYSR